MTDASPPNTSTNSADDNIEHKPAPPPKERRFKLSRACDRCRRRRIKCDEGHPCQSCLAASAACTFEEPGKRTHPHKSKRATTLEDRMQQLETLIQAIPFNLLMPAVQAASSAKNGGAGSSTSTSPNASFASATHAYPLSVPPPSLSLFPLMNPSTRFPTAANQQQPQQQQQQPISAPQQLKRSFEGASVSPSYLYLDDEGYTRWQGESSGLPLLDFLVDRARPGNSASSSAASPASAASPIRESWSRKSENVTTGDWFPNRQPRSVPVQPEAMWRLITSMVAPELMDSLVQCFLSTTYYLMPFLHVPTFLADYGNPSKWGEPGFASFIVAVCCLSSRHIDDPRVRADPNDGFSAGAHWFELFSKLRTVPAADRPTLYTVQAVFVAGVYAIGLGRLSRGFALLAEACTLCIDAGLHRSSEAYDCFGPIEEQVRRRTFWCVYMWDKQAAAAFGRPPMLRLRDCDALEPDEIDDEYVTADAAGPQPAHSASRLGAFVACLRLCVLLEAVLTAPQSIPPSSPFLVRASAILSPPKLSSHVNDKDLQREEALLNDILATVPAYWAHTRETMGSADVLRVTQAERLHCLVLFVRMFIERYRFSRRVVARIHANARNEHEGEQSDAEREAMLACHACAVELVHEHTQVAKKGLMTYYGVHVIHQLTQAGRTLIAVLLNCKTEDLHPLVPPSLEALRACVSLLRRFSGRYICGLRSGELIEEFCRLTRIPLDAPISNSASQQARPPWIRPVRRKRRDSQNPGAASSSSGESRHGSPADDAPTPSASAFSPLSSQTQLGEAVMLPVQSSLSSTPAQLQAQPSDRMLRTGSRGGSLLADLQRNTFGNGSLSEVSNPFSHDSSVQGGLDMNISNGIGSVSDMAELGGFTNFSGLDGLHDMVTVETSNMNGSNNGSRIDGMDGVGMGMSSTTLMNLFNDGSFDMSALFSGDLPVPASAGTPTSSNGDGMMGVVSSP